MSGFSEQLWKSLSSVYGKMLVLLVLVFYLYVNDDHNSISIRQFQVSINIKISYQNYNKLCIQIQHGIIAAYLNATGCCLLTIFYVALIIDKFLPKLNTETVAAGDEERQNNCTTRKEEKLAAREEDRRGISLYMRVSAISTYI